MVFDDPDLSHCPPLLRPGCSLHFLGMSKQERTPNRNDGFSHALIRSRPSHGRRTMTICYWPVMACGM